MEFCGLQPVGANVVEPDGLAEGLKLGERIGGFCGLERIDWIHNHLLQFAVETWLAASPSLRLPCRVQRDGASPVSTRALFAEQVARCLQDGVWGEAELLLQILERGGCSKSLHADDAPFRSSILPPSEGRSHLDSDSRGDLGRKHLIAVTLVLTFEQIPRRHADHARPNAIRF